MIYEIVIPLNPVAQKRARVTMRGRFPHFYDPKESKDFKNIIATYVRQKLFKPLSGGIKLDIKFYIERPKYLMRKKDTENAIPHMAKPDIDNLLKSIMDGMNGVAYEDDSQVCVSSQAKFYTEKTQQARTVIFFEEIYPATY